MAYTTILLRTVLAVALGGAIGVERESKHRPAGFRTHTLVCVGASTVMILSELLFAQYNAAYGIMPDPARMGAQVVSGIGFLGAGTIMRYGANVHGLTTAASIWVTGCIGLAAGAGFYALAGTATSVILITLIVFTKLTTLFSQRPVKRELLIEMQNDPQVIGAVTHLLMHNSIQILSIIHTDDAPSDEESLLLHITFLLRFRRRNQVAPLLKQLTEITGVTSADVL